MTNCIFCKIIKGDIPSAKIWENETHIAFLDINPNTKGMTIVIPKKHFDSEVFMMHDEDLKEFIVAAKKVVKLLELSLNVQRVAIVAEGLGVNHAHFKLYPLHGLDKEFKEMIPPEKVFFEKYEGYVTTLFGPPANHAELQKLADQIKAKNINN